MRAILYTLSAVFIGIAEVSADVDVRIDYNHSTVGFAVPILGGLSEVAGKFPVFTVDFRLNEADFTKSVIVARIDVSAIDTGIDQRDAHLRSRAFFDVKKFPEIVFESTSIKKTDGGYDLVGSLTMHGVEKEIVLPLRITGTHQANNPEKSVVGFEMRTILDRDEWGITYRHDWPFFLGKDIAIRLNILTRSEDFRKVQW